MPSKFEPYIIKYANFQQTQLIDSNGSYNAKVHISDAKKQALEAQMDLVCFNEPSGDKMALCKIVDFGKWKYSQQKKEKKEKKEQQKRTKEIRFSPLIDQHDIEHKIKQINEFLNDDCDVVVTMQIKGRQKAHFKEAEEKFINILNLIPDAKQMSRKKIDSGIMVRLTK